MQKAAALFLTFFLGFSVMLFAQDDSEPDVEPDWGNFSNDVYSRGDQAISIGFGVGFPIVFINNGNVKEHKITPPICGVGAVNYFYYLNSKLFTGGELSLLFFPTIGGNTVFITSLGAKFGTQFILGRFEIPLFLTLGMTIQTYLDYGYFGYFMKGGTGTYFRINSDWSFGIISNLCWYPQWTNEPAKNIDALFVDLAIVGRYQF